MNYQDLFQCLKGVGKFDLSGLSLPVQGTEYALYPVSCNADSIDEDIVDMLTTARNANTNSFLTFFIATNDRTREWLANSVAADSTRILFALKRLDTGSLYGYMGLAYGDAAGTRIEGDAIVRYSEQAEPGLMRTAFVQLVEWVRKGLGISEIWIRVLSDNPAVGFYQRCGFSLLSNAPLYETTNSTGEVEALTESSSENTRPSSRSLAYMKYMTTE
jgi:RimJ/RimL family protein N-acetyltransferase